MNWLNKLERKFGRYAIHNLTMYLIGGYVIGYGIRMFVPNLQYMLTLEPGMILQGQVWRLISWVLIAPSGSIFTLVIMALLYYSLGTALERAWGSFRYNVYIFSGILFTVIGAFVLYLITGGMVGLGGAFSTYYINMSIFLAFAVSYPNMELLLYFILPIKTKRMAYVYGAIILYSLVTGQYSDAYCDHCIPFKFCGVLPVQQECEAIYSKGEEKKSRLQKTVPPPYDISQRCTSQMCGVRPYRAG